MNRSVRCFEARAESVRGLGRFARFARRKNEVRRRGSEAAQRKEPDQPDLAE
jgi:hypothetical protein